MWQSDEILETFSCIRHDVGDSSNRQHHFGYFQSFDVILETFSCIRYNFGDFFTSSTSFWLLLRSSDVILETSSCIRHDVGDFFTSSITYSRAHLCGLAGTGKRSREWPTPTRLQDCKCSTISSITRVQERYRPNGLSFYRIRCLSTTFPCIRHHLGTFLMQMSLARKSLILLI